MLKDIIRKIVKEELYTAYHGSPSGGIVTGKFKKGKIGYMGPGIYFTNDMDYARHYARKMGDGTIYTVQIKLNNPLILSSSNPTEEMLSKVYGTPTVYKKRSMKQTMDTYIIETKDVKKMLSQGYDGIIWRYAGSEEYVLYDNSQITILDTKPLM